MEKNRCEQCEYYRRHYSLDEKQLFRVFCGHCTHKKVRHKRPFAIACEDFKQAAPQEDAFVRKEYLSKHLLDYMKKLEFLPEIYESKKKL